MRVEWRWEDKKRENANRETKVEKGTSPDQLPKSQKLSWWQAQTQENLSKGLRANSIKT